MCQFNSYEHQERQIWKMSQGFNGTFSKSCSCQDFIFKRPKDHREAILLVGPPFSNKGTIYTSCIIPSIKDRQNTYLISDTDIKIVCEHPIEEVSCKLKNMMLIPENKKLIIDSYWAYSDDIVSLASGLNHIGISKYDIHVVFCLQHPDEMRALRDRFSECSKTSISDLVLYTQFTGHLRMLQDCEYYMNHYCSGDWWVCYSEHNDTHFFNLKDPVKGYCVFPQELKNIVEAIRIAPPFESF